MGGKLSIKKGCGAGDSKKNKATAEAADNPDAKQTDPPREDSPQTQPQATGIPAENPAPDEGGAEPGTSAESVAQEPDTKQPTADVTVSPPSEGQDLTRSGSEEPEKSDSVDAAPGEEDSEAATMEAAPPAGASPATTSPEVQETGTETRVVAAATREEGQTSGRAAGEIPATPVREITVAEISVDQKPILISPTTAHPAEGDHEHLGSALPEKDSSVDHLETKVKDCEEKTPGSGQSDVMVAESKLLGEPESASPETAGEETAWSFIRGLEPEVQRVAAEKAAEIPTLDMAEETPIDLVLKNEISTCPGQPENNAVETPRSPAEAPETVESESPVHSVAPVTGSQGESGQVAAPDVKTQQSPERPKEQVDVQGSQGSVRIPEDPQPPEGFVEDCGQTHKDVADTIEEDKPDGDPAMAEPIQAVPSPKAEEVVSITTHEHTVTKTALPDSMAEISLLKTSSELIPDIKLTVYTEVFEEEEKVESHYGDPSHQVSTLEEIPPEAVSAGSAMKTDSNPLDEPTVERESVGSGAIIPEAESDAQETKESLDQVATTPELTDPSCAGPEPPSPDPLVNVTEEHKETNSATTDNGVTLDSEGKGARAPANVQETSVVNGTSVDSDKSDPGKAEENGQEVSCDKLGMKPLVECEITEEVDKLVGEQDSGLVKLDN